ncbi:hypothetical protein [Micromonospora sp. NBC_01813]|uniref:hypothetical protein n=1 Tax=Micromonospora sp. NBC_01813 TaxID=2975988 RepID=UPI003FA35092
MAKGGGRSWTGPAAVVLVLFGVFAIGASGDGGWRDLLAGGNNPPPREFPVLEPSRPIRIAIPSLEVRAPVHSVGVADDGSIAVPPLHRHNQAGWYDRGRRRGSSGRRSSSGTRTPATGRRSSTAWPTSSRARPWR